MLGSLLRLGLSNLFNQSRPGTLAANLAGVAFASFFLVIVEHRGSNILRHLLLPGFCGGLTTFSALALQTLEPSSGGALYLIETVLLSLLVVGFAIPLARKVFQVSR